jgi:hypothetical protein
MKNFLLPLLLLSSFYGCGVETDSSSNSTTYITDGELDDNSSQTQDSLTDGTSSINPDGSINVDSGTISNNGFSTADALYDSSACLVNDTYLAIDDSSFDPLSNVDVENGIEINSDYPYDSDVEETKVAIYYPRLTQPLINKSINVYSDTFYRFGFDEAWVDNENQTIYIRTPRGDKNYNICYRYTLNSLVATTITPTKVYR